MLNGSPALKDLTPDVEENHPSSATQCWMTSALKHWRSVLSKVSSPSRRPAAHRSQVNYDLIFERHSWYLRSGGYVLAAQTHSKGRETQEPQLVHRERGPKNPISRSKREGGPRTPGADEQDVAWASSPPPPRSTIVVEGGLSVTSPRSGTWAALRCKSPGDALLLGAPEPDRGLREVRKPSVPAAGRKPKTSRPAADVVREPLREKGRGDPRTPAHAGKGTQGPQSKKKVGDPRTPGPSQTLVARRGGTLPQLGRSTRDRVRPRR